MSTELVSILLFGGLVVLLALGVPVVFALGGICVLITALLGGSTDLFIVATTAYRQITDPGLITIPLFLLMGNFLIHSGISDRLFAALNHWLSGLRGGLAIVSIGVCVALAMCGGFGPGILTMGLIAVPAMLKNRYDTSLALGSVMAGGVLGEIIPPSIIMIIFAYISRISIGRIFFGGAIPGLITACLYILYVTIRCHLQPSLAPPAAEDVTWKLRWASLKDIVLPSLLVVLVMGSIFMGIATPTEAAGVALFYSILIELFVHREVKPRDLFNIAVDTTKMFGTLFPLVAVAMSLNILLATHQVPDLLANWMTLMIDNKIMFILGLNVLLLIVGCFMDIVSAILILAPLFLPIVLKLNIDPIHFGIIMTVNMEIGMITPPVGLNLFVASGISGLSLWDVFKGAAPFMVIMLAALFIITYIPVISLWFPKLLYGALF